TADCADAQFVITAAQRAAAERTRRIIETPERQWSEKACAEPIMSGMTAAAARPFSQLAVGLS
ncbi:MAG: hypothetical protein E7A86_14270, partial [Bradyrhizobium sp.]|nr:hypothetical protein [Bradyrhizobium sp.]